jgi:addiction module RelB/DinJ family antitoxin
MESYQSIVSDALDIDITFVIRLYRIDNVITITQRIIIQQTHFMNTLQIRLDPKTKREAKRVLDRLGLDMSAAIKIYFRQISRTQGIPFPLVTENGFTSPQEQQLVRESNATLQAYKKGRQKGYRTTKNLLRAFLK